MRRHDELFKNGCRGLARPRFVSPLIVVRAAAWRARTDATAYGCDVDPIRDRWPFSAAAERAYTVRHPLSRGVSFCYHCGYQWGCTVAAASSHRPAEHVKKVKQNLTTEVMMQAVVQFLLHLKANLLLLSVRLNYSEFRI